MAQHPSTFADFAAENFHELEIMRYAGLALASDLAERSGRDRKAADRATAEIASQISAVLAEASDQDLVGLVTLARTRLEAMSSEPEILHAIDRADAHVAEKADIPQGALTGSGGNISRAFMVFISFLVGYTCLDFKVSGDNWEVQHHSGVPESVLQLVDKIVPIVSDFKKPPARTEKPETGGGGQGSLPSAEGAQLHKRGEGSPVRSEARPRSVEKLPSGAKATDVSSNMGFAGPFLSFRRQSLSLPEEIRSLLQVDRMTLQEAQACKAQLWHFFHVKKALEPLNKCDPKEMFHRRTSGFSNGGDPKKKEWHSDQHFSIGVGLIRLEPHAGDNQPYYHIALRLQSLCDLKLRFSRWLFNQLEQALGPHASIRWTSKVIGLPGDGEALGKWRGAKDVPQGPAIGAAINAAGEAPGAVTLAGKYEGKPCVITAGHVVQGSKAQLVPDTKMFSPVAPRVTAGHTPIGRLHSGEIFPVLRPGMERDEQGKGRDFAIIALRDDCMPTKWNTVNTSTIHLPWATEEDAVVDAKVMKGPGRTNASLGKISSIQVDIEVDNLATGMPHFGADLIEVSLDSDKAIQPGDSGTLLAIEISGKWQPLGIVVAGALTSRLRGREHKSSSAVYVVPFFHILESDRFTGFQV
jgi:hypothetical protein